MTVRYDSDGAQELQASFTSRASTDTVGRSGNRLADGVLSGYAWAVSSITFAFPNSKNDYSYRNEPQKGFSAVNDRIEDAARRVLDQSFGNAANDGFSLEGFTNLTVTPGSHSDADIRYAESREANPTAYAYYPVRGDRAGDVWFGKDPIYNTPKPGNYAFATVIHETGHALGLKHGHDSDKFDLIRPTLPAKYDSLEYSVMTYHSFVGQKGEKGYTNELLGFPQTFMMADILALQHMYGADYTTNGGDTVYSWKPNSGKTFVNGEAGISPGANRIFATIWDGGGVDTYDLSAYRKGVTIDLRPGQESSFKTSQLADLSQFHNGKLASGNIYNALLFEGDERSLIENAIGGRGNDRFYGNAADNAFTGRGGIDIFFLNVGQGNDVFTDFSEIDKINIAKMGLTHQEALALATDVGGDVLFDFGGGDTLTLLNYNVADLGLDNFTMG